RFGDTLYSVAKVGGDEFGRISIELVALLHHLALAHHELDDVGHADGHTVGEFLNRDGFRDNDFALDLFALAPAAHHFRAAFFFLLLRSTIGRQRTDAIVVALADALHHVERELAFAALRLALLGRLHWRGRQRLARGLDTAAQFVEQRGVALRRRVRARHGR